MKLSSIFALFTLCSIVKGAWWAAAVQPVILGFGAVFTAINLDVLDLDANSFEWKNWLGLMKEKAKPKPEPKPDPVEEYDDEQRTNLGPIRSKEEDAAHIADAYRMLREAEENPESW